MSLVPRKPQTARRSDSENQANASTTGTGGHQQPKGSLTARETTSTTLPQLINKQQDQPQPEASPPYHPTNLTLFEQDEIRGYSQVYYSGENCADKIPAPTSGPNYGFDDDRGDYTLKMRDHVQYRYEMMQTVGRGSFGQVVRCHDHKTGQQVALKVIRNKKRFHQQAQVEIRVLQHLRDRDPEGKYGIVKLVDTFVFRSHVCLTYELLSMNLYEYMKLTNFRKMSLNLVKKIGASLLISLAFMWRENIVHCDLKPENILLRQPNRTGVKVIDLGSACFENEKIYTYIQSRFYRAPEIILGIPYTRRIDLWSYACVLCELAKGYPLFPGESEAEQLACIMETLDVPPPHVLDSASAKARANFFDSSRKPKLVPNSRNKVHHPNTRNLAQWLDLDSDHPFVEFIMMFLQWDPDARPAPEPAMRHPWICDAYVGVTPRMPTVPTSSRAKQRPQAGGGQQRVVAAGEHQQQQHQQAPPQAAATSNNGGGNDQTSVPHLPSIPPKGMKK